MLYQASDGGNRQGSILDEPNVLAIIQKEIKARQESIRLHRCGRTDLIEAAVAEQKVLEEFLPAQLSEEEITQIAGSN